MRLIEKYLQSGVIKIRPEVRDSLSWQNDGVSVRIPKNITLDDLYNLDILDRKYANNELIPFELKTYQLPSWMTRGEYETLLTQLQANLQRLQEQLLQVKNAIELLNSTLYPNWLNPKRVLYNRIFNK